CGPGVLGATIVSFERNAESNPGYSMRAVDVGRSICWNDRIRLSPWITSAQSSLVAIGTKVVLAGCHLSPRRVLYGPDLANPFCGSVSPALRDFDLPNSNSGS